MIISQINIFIFAIVLGIFLGLCFDFFRIINEILKVNLKRIFFEDIIYFVFSAVITFMYLLVVNSGEIRFYIIGGEIIGWILYRLTIGKLIYKLNLSIAKLLVNWILKVKTFIVRKILNKKLKDKIKKVKIIFKKRLSFNKIKNKKANQKLYKK